MKVDDTIYNIAYNLPGSLERDTSFEFTYDKKSAENSSIAHEESRPFIHILPLPERIYEELRDIIHKKHPENATLEFTLDDQKRTRMESKATFDTHDETASIHFLVFVVDENGKYKPIDSLCINWKGSLWDQEAYSLPCKIQGIIEADRWKIRDYNKILNALETPMIYRGEPAEQLLDTIRLKDSIKRSHDLYIALDEELLNRRLAQDPEYMLESWMEKAGTPTERARMLVKWMNTLRDPRDVILLEKTIEKHPSLFSEKEELERFMSAYMSGEYEKEAIHEFRRRINLFIPLPKMALEGETPRGFPERDVECVLEECKKTLGDILLSIMPSPVLEDFLEELGEKHDLDKCSRHRQENGGGNQRL
ncbi:MAG: hypothetical protein H0Z28_11945 [Archaeoglobus sp.]|nr:hypothetical protein [Archaeoglobus sp.]